MILNTSERYIDLSFFVEYWFEFGNPILLHAKNERSQEFIFKLNREISPEHFEQFEPEIMEKFYNKETEFFESLRKKEGVFLFSGV